MYKINGIGFACYIYICLCMFLSIVTLIIAKYNVFCKNYFVKNKENTRLFKVFLLFVPCGCLSDTFFHSDFLQNTLYVDKKYKLCYTKSVVYWLLIGNYVEASERERYIDRE